MWRAVEKLYQFDAMLPDKIRRGVLYWFTYGMDNQREYKFCEVRQILKRCIEFHYTKSVTADLDMYRLVYETIARTLGHSVATSTEHYGTIANYPPSVNAADVLRSRHFGPGLASAGVASQICLGFDGEIVEPEGREDRNRNKKPGDVWMMWYLMFQLYPASPVNEELSLMKVLMVLGWMRWHLIFLLAHLSPVMRRLRKLNPCVMILAEILFMQMMRLILFRICLWKFLA